MMGCLGDLLMWVVVVPALGVLIAIASVAADPAPLVGAVVLALLLLGLYLLASWG